MVATGDSENNTMIFIAKWEKISNNIVEYYEDRSSTEPFESHYFDDGELVQYPTMTVYPQVLINVRVQDKKEAQDDPDVQAAVAEVAAKLGDSGRILVRESGTEPKIRVMVEAPSKKTCQECVDQVVDMICSQGHARV